MKHHGKFLDYPYERTEDRVGCANGFKPKQIKSRVGQLNMNVPQVQESDLSIFPRVKTQIMD
ncbi:MAG: transposase [Alphaproteobacteria bacterium]|nr:transposase [Alphaproteobacteria bacterium]